jgi:hypothetical protein
MIACVSRRQQYTGRVFEDGSGGRPRTIPTQYLAFYILIHSIGNKPYSDTSFAPERFSILDNRWFDTNHWFQRDIFIFVHILLVAAHAIRERILPSLP